jgi:hypothetical protein
MHHTSVQTPHFDCYGQKEALVSISTEENNILESFKAQSHIL